jgi:hypothetical protein
MLFPLEKQTLRRPVLTEGAVIERLNRRPDISMDPALLNGPLIYDRHGRDQMAEIINGYIDIGRRAGLGLLVASSTWEGQPRTGGEFGFQGPAGKPGRRSLCYRALSGSRAVCFAT